MKMKSAGLGLVVLSFLLGGVLACDKNICASKVSGCQLIQACECNMEDKKNCSCCYNCQACLADLYMECCSCVGMCPLPDPEQGFSRTSAIEELNDPIPDLFSVLTEEEDYLKRWTTYRYPVFFDTLYSRETNMEPGLDKKSDPDLHFEGQQNCTVAFMSECMPMARCRLSCQSMGAAKYRWFHDAGCCQCIGKPCKDFGLNEAKCLKCKGEEENDNYTPGEDKDELREEIEDIHIRHPHHNHRHKHDQVTENN